MEAAVGEFSFFLAAGAVGGLVAYLFARRTRGSWLAHVLIALSGVAAVFIILTIVGLVLTIT